MSTGKSGDRRYSDICGATNNRGESCKLPAGWGTPGSGGKRCKFHGGASTGPEDKSHLVENDFAEENPGGGPPEGNTNAKSHGAFCDWQKAYERFDKRTKDYVNTLRADMRETAKEHAPNVNPARRETLLKEKATLAVMQRRASMDVWGDLDGSGPGRGLVIEKDIEHDGKTYTTEKMNPAIEATTVLSSRQRKIAKELRLRPGFQDE